MDRGAWQATVLEVKESDMTEQLNTHTHTHTHTQGLKKSGAFVRQTLLNLFFQIKV